MQVFNFLQLSCGFAAIEAGGALQHMDWFESGPKLGSKKHLEIRGIQQLEGCRMRWCLVGWTGCSSVLLNMGDILGHMLSSWHWQPRCLLVLFPSALEVLGSPVPLQTIEAAKDYSLYRSRSQPGRLPYRVSLDSEGLDLTLKNVYPRLYATSDKVAYSKHQ